MGTCCTSTRLATDQWGPRGGLAVSNDVLLDLYLPAAISRSAIRNEQLEETEAERYEVWFMSRGAWAHHYDLIARMIFSSVRLGPRADPKTQYTLHRLSFLHCTEPHTRFFQSLASDPPKRPPDKHLEYLSPQEHSVRQHLIQLYDLERKEQTAWRPVLAFVGAPRAHWRSFFTHGMQLTAAQAMLSGRPTIESPPQSVSGDTGIFGTGHYVTLTPDVAARWSPRTESGNVLSILCWCLVGEPYPVLEQLDTGAGCMRHFTSHYVLTDGHMPAADVERGWSGDELVLFDTAHILPMFVAEWSQRS